MARLMVTIPDARLQMVIMAVSDQLGYRETIQDNPETAPTPNPETRQDFVERMMEKWIWDNVLASRTEKDMDAARRAAITAVDLDRPSRSR